MNRLVILALGAALAAGACGTDASDATDTPLTSEAGPAANAPAPQPAAAAAVAPADPVDQVAPPESFYREVTIPAGTTLPLALTSAVGSDSSLVEDAVTAELTRPVMIDGREALPAGARMSGTVTGVDGSGRVKGRAMIAFRFTSVRTGNAQYDVQAAPLSHLAPATKGEDAAKIGIGAGAGAIIGGILGGKDGAAKGAVVGGGAGTGVVLATKGQEIRLGPGADVSTPLTAPLTVRVRRN